MTETFIYQLVSQEEGVKCLTISELEATGLIEDLYLPNPARPCKKELIGQPELTGYLGPMYNGVEKGKTVIRYETLAEYKAQSFD